MFRRVVRPKYVNAARYAGLLLMLTAVVYVGSWRASNDVHAAKCDSIYYNLLRVNYKGTVPAILFIREFFETSICDDIFNMSVYRGEYATKINRGDEMRLQRIIDFKSNQIDEAIAAQAVLHYHAWHQRRLLKAVSWSSWWSYYTSVMAK